MKHSPAVNKKEIMSFMGKWMQLNCVKWIKPVSVRQTLYVFSHRWFLDLYTHIKSYIYVIYAMYIIKYIKLEMKMSGETKRMKGVAGRTGKEEGYGGCAQCVWKPSAHWQWTNSVKTKILKKKAIQLHICIKQWDPLRCLLIWKLI